MNDVIKLDLPLKNIIKKAENKTDHSPSIFFLHGFGSNMQDLFGLSPFFGKDWTCVSLQASIPVQYNGWAWAELDYNNIRKLPRPEQMHTHQKKVFQSIEKSIEFLDLNPKKINLLGFSQGASLSIYTGLKNAGKLNSIVAICGYFPADQVKDEIDFELARDLNLFLANGRLDQIVPIGLGHSTKNELVNLGIVPNYHEYDSEHTISNECLRDVLDWLKENNL